MNWSSGIEVASEVAIEPETEMEGAAEPAAEDATAETDSWKESPNEWRDSDPASPLEEGAPLEEGGGGVVVSLRLLAVEASPWEEAVDSLLFLPAPCAGWLVLVPPF